MALSVSYESRDSADTIKVDAKDGDTLAAIVAAHPDRFKSWQDLALYNWGTDVAAEVNRALFETIGCSAIDPADPSKTVLKPHADAAKPQIFLAKPFTADGLVQGKTYVMTIDKLRPPTAVAIDALDRWFVPGKETCELKYSLEGSKECAKRVALEVYGSNYAAPGAYNRGLGTFPAAADKVDVALYTNEESADAPERAAGQSIKAWKGTVTATDGALGSKNPKDGGGTEDRVVNVAFSPYTAHLRYFLDDADKDARLVLEPFWPQFDGAGAAVPASLEVKWNIRKTARLGGGKGSGQLRIVDGKGRLVFRKPLPAAQLVEKAGGPHKFAWDGNYGEAGVTNSKGGTKAIAEDMPYRAAIEAHTVASEVKGLALAAMHTEVRLYVHPSTHLPDLDPYVVGTDKSSLRLATSHDLLATRPIARGDGTIWCKHQLARGGFHPGPVTGDAGHAAYKLALTEFKRSVPQRKAGAADYQRFALDLSEGDDVKDALEDLTTAADWQRPWFGAPDGGRADLAPAVASERLRDPTQEVILWVDDRHTYTDPDWLAGVAQGPAVRNKVKGAPAATGDHMGGYSQGDPMVDKKAKSIPRPWIPLAADLVLLGKADDLDKEIALPGDADLAIMRKAVGPLRVDWTFLEIDADPPDQTQVDVAQYDKRVTRSRAFDKQVLGALKATHARKDVKLSAIYHNCPESAGGVRPSAAGTYYKKVFALGADSLRPWEAVDAAGREAVATIVHDNLGQSGDDLVAACIGRAGVYFHPSTIAGDGYRVRAQVQFAAQGDYKLPNLAVLKARYPRLPQAHSAAIRLWRKASVRAFVCWSDKNDWATTKDATFKMFEPGFLHFVFERGNAGVDGKVTDHLADDNAFKALVREALQAGAPANSPNGRRALAGAIKLTEKRTWPWHDDSQFGLYEASAPNATLAAAVSALLSNPINPLFFTLSNLFGLALVQQLEAKKGRLRGHVIVQMRCSDPLYMQQYRCATCNKKYYYAEKNRLGGAKRGQLCPTPACAGTLAELGAHYVGHYTCTPNGHKGAWEEAGGAAGGGFTGAGCVVAGCGGTLNPDQVPREQYKCSVCATTIWLEEPGAGGSHDGEPCRQAGCAGVLAHTGSVFKEKYRCDKCGLLDEKVEPAAAGGSFAGQPHAACAQNPKGNLQRQGPPAITETHTITNGNKVDAFRTELTGYGDTIPVPSLGNPLGVAWNFAGNHELWAHETAHTRHMEHAGNAPGANGPQHDPVNNTGFNWAGINETTVDGQHWDRACLMTYASHRRTYDAARDRVYPCGRCSLKLRGWKLAGVAAPGSAVQDP